MLWTGYCPHELQATGEAAGTTFDLVELNHYYKDGKLDFDQIIFYDYSFQYRRWHVQGYLLVDGIEPVHPPYRVGGKWKVRTSKGVVRWGRMFRETWTTHDPERENKRVFEEKYRRGLGPR
jgi:hypothetical protein